MEPVEFWVSIGSARSYLSVMRLEEVAAQAGVSVVWNVFNLCDLRLAQGIEPEAAHPLRAGHMWRDIGRRAAGAGLAPVLPAPWPLDRAERANRVALVGLEDGWGASFIRESYRRWFDLGEPAGNEPNLSRSLAAVGQVPSEVFARADGAHAAEALEVATGEAAARGIFRAPSFVVGGELFCGDRALEAALEWGRCSHTPEVFEGQRKKASGPRGRGPGLALVGGRDVSRGGRLRS